MPQLVVDRDTFSNGFASYNTSARQANEWVIGTNWYWNRNMKLTLDYADTGFVKGAPNLANRRESDIETQLQVLF